MLKKGSSENWRDVLEKYTAERDMSIKAIKDYFAPLEEFLDEQIQNNEIEVSNHNSSLFKLISIAKAVL